MVVCHVAVVLVLVLAVVSMVVMKVATAVVDEDVAPGAGLVAAALYQAAEGSEAEVEVVMDTRSTVATTATTRTTVSMMAKTMTDTRPKA